MGISIKAVHEVGDLILQIRFGRGLRHRRWDFQRAKVKQLCGHLNRRSFGHCTI